MPQRLQAETTCSLFFPIKIGTEDRRTNEIFCDTVDSQVISTSILNTPSVVANSILTPSINENILFDTTDSTLTISPTQNYFGLESQDPDTYYWLKTESPGRHFNLPVGSVLPAISNDISIDFTIQRYALNNVIEVFSIPQPTNTTPATGSIFTVTDTLDSYFYWFEITSNGLGTYTSFPDTLIINCPPNDGRVNVTRWRGTPFNAPELVHILQNTPGTNCVDGQSYRLVTESGTGGCFGIFHKTLQTGAFSVVNISTSNLLIGDILTTQLVVNNVLETCSVEVDDINNGFPSLKVRVYTGFLNNNQTYTFNCLRLNVNVECLFRTSDNHYGEYSYQATEQPGTLTVIDSTGTFQLGDRLTDTLTYSYEVSNLSPLTVKILDGQPSFLPQSGSTRSITCPYDTSKSLTYQFEVYSSTTAKPFDATSDFALTLKGMDTDHITRCPELRFNSGRVQLSRPEYPKFEMKSGPDDTGESNVFYNLIGNNLYGNSDLSYYLINNTYTDSRDDANDIVIHRCTNSEFQVYVPVKADTFQYGEFRAVNYTTLKSVANGIEYQAIKNGELAPIGRHYTQTPANDTHFELYNTRFSLFNNSNYTEELFYVNEAGMCQSKRMTILNDRTLNNWQLSVKSNGVSNDSGFYHSYDESTDTGSWAFQIRNDSNIVKVGAYSDGSLSCDTVTTTQSRSKKYVLDDDDIEIGSLIRSHVDKFTSLNNRVDDHDQAVELTSARLTILEMQGNTGTANQLLKNRVASLEASVLMLTQRLDALTQVN